MPEDTCLAVGLMSGTSMDGIDAALIETDGEAVVWRGPALTHPYDADFRRDLRAALGHDPLIRVPENDLIGSLTDRHRDAVRALLAAAGVSAAVKLAVDLAAAVPFYGGAPDAADVPFSTWVGSAT